MLLEIVRIFSHAVCSHGSFSHLLHLQEAKAKLKESKSVELSVKKVKFI